MQFLWPFDWLSRCGASYCDLIFGYNFASGSFHEIVSSTLFTLTALDEILPDISFPFDDESKLKGMELGFASLSGGLFRGTVSAGDGVLFRMDKPCAAEVKGDVSSYFTRKGYSHAMIALCDSKCRFTNISTLASGSIHDSQHYALSNMSRRVRAGHLPAWAHLVVDDAFTCTDSELTPWSGRNLSRQCDAFNYYVSLWQSSC
jgi:hypothetical protein